MNDDDGPSLTMHLDPVATAVAPHQHHATTDEGASFHGRFQETYTRHAYRTEDTTGPYTRAARYQEVATSPPFMLPEASALLPTHHEEEEEDEVDKEDDEELEDEVDDDDDIMDEDDDEEEEDDDLVDLANRAFIATCQKFARQNYPEYRRRAPYSFLESWHLHSMYSKSQQILLGIPHAQPVVLLSGDDFMFTPQLVQQQHFDRMEQQMQFDWNDDEYDTNPPMDDDDDVLLVTARSPLPDGFMDENTWMSSRHSHHLHQSLVEDQLQDLSIQPLLGNGYHITNPDIVDDDDDDQEDQEQQHDNEQQEHEAGERFTMSPEIVHWYRSAQYHRPPSTIFTPDSDTEEQDEHKGKDIQVDSYQSLADMIPAPSAPPAEEVVIPIPPAAAAAAMVTHDGYGSVRQVRSIDNNDNSDDYRIFYFFDLYHVSTRLSEAMNMAVDRIETDNEKQGVGQFFTLLFSVWRILFVCVEMILADILLGSSNNNNNNNNTSLCQQQQQQQQQDHQQSSQRELTLQQKASASH